MEIKKQILSVLSKVTGISESEIKLEKPENQEFGDFTSNIAMQSFQNVKKVPGVKILHKFASKVSGQNPGEMANNIKNQFIEGKLLVSIIEKVTVEGPGFINFYLKKDVLFDTLVYISSHKDTFGYSDKLKGKKVVVEYTDPNPFKEFHVGHLYSNTVGESISRLLESQGAKVWRADYFGDVGMHTAKAIWGLVEKFKNEKITLEDLKKRTLNERIEYMGQAYAMGATAYEEHENAKEDMKVLNFLIFKAAQEVVLPEFSEKPQVDYDQYIKESIYDYKEIKEIYETGRSWSMDYFETIYKRVGTQFDGYYPESRTGEFGYGMVLDALRKGIFEKGEGGAVIFPGEKYGLHNRVFINAMNLPTYEAKDFGNAVVKYKDFAYDKSVIVTGNEINEYFVVVLKALSMYRPELAEATTHIGHGMVRLPEGKMSSRTGKIIRGEWVLDEAKKKEFEIIAKSDSFSKSTDSEKDKIAEIVAVAAVKYAFLKQGIGNNIAFDFETSLSLEGNSGPYIQYTYARTQSVLAKAHSANDKIQKFEKSKLENSSEINEEEALLLRSFIYFPEIVAEAAVKYSPNLVCTYLYELAQKYNSFYNQHKVIGSENEELRLKLTEVTGQILKNGLDLLGIKDPSKM